MSVPRRPAANVAIFSSFMMSPETETDFAGNLRGRRGGAMSNRPVLLLHRPSPPGAPACGEARACQPAALLDTFADRQNTLAKGACRYANEAVRWMFCPMFSAPSA